MKKLFASLWLIFNFIKAAIQSGYTTAKIILLRPNHQNSGFCYMHYQQLEGYPLLLLGMLITLTPGSTVMDINEEQQMITIHLLDMDDENKTIQQIEGDYIKHLSQWSTATAAH